MTDRLAGHNITNHGCVSDEKVAALDALEFGWYDRTSYPPTDAAMAVVRCLAIVPLYSGGIQIEWHANGQDVEIEIGTDGWVISTYTSEAK